jgi:hypothetical protein
VIGDESLSSDKRSKAQLKKDVRPKMKRRNDMKQTNNSAALVFKQTEISF